LSNTNGDARLVILTHAFLLALSPNWCWKGWSGVVVIQACVR
jgi:hypothetical protein